MGKQISAAEHSLAEIFSSKFEYNIPPYQRPYAWKEEQASELFDDLYSFYKDEASEGYFLGSIVLIKEENEPKSDVIDGQQRLTTLTMLLACLAHHVGKIADNRDDYKYQKELEEYILEPGKETQGIESKPRLNIRERDKDFFEIHIHSLTSDDTLAEDSEQSKNESQKLIIINRNYFLKRIKEVLSNGADTLDMSTLKAFVKFLMTRCFLVAVSTPNEKSASRIFSVMNDRGLPLQATDIIKAEVIGNLDSHNPLNQSWEEMEAVLGREGFNDLFTYVRMIYAKEKPRKELQEEFQYHVLRNINNNPDKLIKKILEPHCDALSIIRGHCYESTSNAEDVNYYLKWLSKINNSDWIPPAIQFLSQKKNDSEYVLNFFQKLERLSAYLYICSKNVNVRIERYAEVIEEMESEHSLQNPPKSLELADYEKQEMIEALSSNIYELSSQKRNYIILQLDSLISDGGATYKIGILTIEHVLPQMVREDSEWATLWPDEDQRINWLHKLGNILPLNKRKNSAAQNYDFERKKTVYFSGTEHANSYALTNQVILEEEWTPEVVERRQEKLIKILTDNWKLG